MNMKFEPRHIMSDFGISLIEAVLLKVRIFIEICMIESFIPHSFPNARHRGCFFHYCQAIYRNIHSIGLESDGTIFFGMRTTGDAQGLFDGVIIP